MRDIIEDFNSGKFSKRDEIADLQVYQLDGITYCLPINSTPKLRQYFATAILAYKNDANFDDILPFQDIEKYNDKDWVDGDLVVCFMLAREVDVLLNVIVDFHDHLTKKGHRFTSGEFAFFNTMTRLRESFKSVLVLCNRGFFIEMMPILRLIYEQLCWACYSIDETDSEKLKQNWKTKNTRYLKEKINPEYGRLYSILSTESHMALPEMGKYLEIDESNMIAAVKGRSGIRAKQEIPYIIILYRIFLEVFQYGINHFEECDKEYYTEFINGQFPLIKLMQDIHHKKRTDFSFLDRV